MVAISASPGPRLWREFLGMEAIFPHQLKMHFHSWFSPLTWESHYTKSLSTGPSGHLLASPPPPLRELYPSVYIYYEKGGTTKQYVTAVIITFQTPIMPSAADLSPFLSFNHPLASLTLTE